MGFLKKLIISFGALALIFSSGAGVKSDNIVLQAGAVLGLIIGLVVLYVFIKMAWRAMGCLPAIFIIFALVFFIMYGIGAFSGGLDNVSENVQDFLGQNIRSAENLVDAEKFQQEEAEVKEEIEKGIVNLIDEDKHKIFTEDLRDKFLPKTKTVTQTSSFNPLKYPGVFGQVRVLSGDTLVINGLVVKLYAVAAPDIKQTCAAHDGRGYRCGQQSAMWLSNWLSDNEVECHIIQETGQGSASGVCILGAYDIGAAIINSGWAVADVSQSNIYQPYQNQAVEHRRGLWDGKFYMPWDWQKIQNRKANIKVIKKKRPIERAHSFFFF